MENETKKKRGAPEGNQYARKHGYYSHVLSDEEQADYDEATLVEGIDEEIALMRVKLKSLILHDPENLRLINLSINALCKLVSTKFNLRKDDKQGLAEAVMNVMKDIALPLGIATLFKK